MPNWGQVLEEIAGYHQRANAAFDVGDGMSESVEKITMTDELRKELGVPANCVSISHGGMSNWQPIETAPKDGTCVLVWVDVHGEHVTSVPYACAAYFGGDWWRDRRTGQFLVGRPTHWQPLPEPPK